MALVLAGDEGAHVRHRGVVPEYSGDRIDEGALAIGAGAVGEDKDVFGREAGAAIADVALQEALQLGVAVSDAHEKVGPLRMRRAGRGCAARRLFGDVVEGIGRPPGAGTQVVSCSRHVPSSCVEEPRLVVPLGNGCRQSPVGRCEPRDGSNGLCRCDRACRSCLVTRERHLAADGAGPVECVQRVVEGPMRAGVAHPTRPGGDVAQLVHMPVGVGQRDRLFGGGGKLPAVLQLAQLHNVFMHWTASVIPCRQLTRRCARCRQAKAAAGTAVRSSTAKTRRRRRGRRGGARGARRAL